MRCLQSFELLSVVVVVKNEFLIFVVVCLFVSLTVCLFVVSSDVSFAVSFVVCLFVVSVRGLCVIVVFVWIL